MRATGRNCCHRHATILANHYRLDARAVHFVLTDVMDELMHALARQSLDATTVLDELPSAGWSKGGHQGGVMMGQTPTGHGAREALLNALSALAAAGEAAALKRVVHQLVDDQDHDDLNAHRVESGTPTARG